jgi:antitoxin ParD1/3/4
MDSLTVELPEGLRRFLEAEANERGLGTAGDYLVALADQERERKTKARLEAHLLESLRSGPSIEVTDEYWEAKLERLDARDTPR